MVAAMIQGRLCGRARHLLGNFERDGVNEAIGNFDATALLRDEVPNVQIGFGDASFTRRR